MLDDLLGPFLITLMPGISRAELEEGVENEQFVIACFFLLCRYFKDMFSEEINYNAPKRV